MTVLGMSCPSALLGTLPAWGVLGSTENWVRGHSRASVPIVTAWPGVVLAGLRANSDGLQGVNYISPPHCLT